MSSARRGQDPGRLAFVYESLYPHSVGGASRYYWTLAEALSGQLPVTYITSRYLPDRTTDVDGIEVIGVSPLPKPRSLLPKLAFALGVLVHLLRHGGRYSVVHCACFPHVAVIASRIGLIPHRRTPLVVDWHEVIPRETWRRRRGILGELGNLAQALAIPCGDKAVTFSQRHRRRLEAQRPPGTVFVLPEFLPEVDPPEFDADAPREKLIVFLGRLVHEKRADLVPAVVAELRRSDPEWRGVIFGKGPDKENVAAAVDRAGQADSVRLAGLAPWDEVSETMSRASCLVFPTQREGFGLVVLEAASHGLPAVLVDGEDNAAVELIEAHRNGLVCPEPDPGRLAQAVLELSADAGIHARTREWYDAASERLSVPNAVKELLELDDLAGEPSAPAELRT